jgi:hypothetical protein
MSLLPSLRAHLRDGLTDAQAREIVEKIKNTDGVISAAFNDAANGTVLVSYLHGRDVVRKLEKIDGIASFSPPY